MQVKIFESSDMATGLKMVKKELGPDALILSTKTIRSGKYGLLSKPRLEITAAIDSPSLDQTFPVSPPREQKKALNGSITNNRTTAPPTLKPVKEFATYNSTCRLRKTEETGRAEPSLPAPVSAEQNALQSEVNELKGMIRSLAQEMVRKNSPQAVSAPMTTVDLQPSETLLSPEETNGLHSLRQRILDYGISAETAHAMSSNALETLKLEGITDLFQQQKFIAEAIRERLQVNTNIFPAHNNQHRLALVGPTGVGKTTTLAKIAAEYLCKHSPSIALITIDTYRIAAVEQLKVYGEIMNLPVEVVLNPQQLEQMLTKHQDKELILIDTAGRSPQDTLCIEELASFLPPDLAIEKHLVLSATTREKELYEAMKRFSVLGIDNAIVTKIDECSSLGMLLDIQQQENIPFSYITNGQRVPEDLLQADKEALTQLIMSPGEGV